MSTWSLYVTPYLPLHEPFDLGSPTRAPTKRPPGFRYATEVEDSETSKVSEGRANQLCLEDVAREVSDVVVACGLRIIVGLDFVEFRHFVGIRVVVRRCSLDVGN